MVTPGEVKERWRGVPSVLRSDLAEAQVGTPLSSRKVAAAAESLSNCRCEQHSQQCSSKFHTSSPD